MENAINEATVGLGTPAETPLNDIERNILRYVRAAFSDCSRLARNVSGKQYVIRHERITQSRLHRYACKVRRMQEFASSVYIDMANLIGDCDSATLEQGALGVQCGRDADGHRTIDVTAVDAPDLHVAVDRKWDRALAQDVRAVNLRRVGVRDAIATLMPGRSTPFMAVDVARIAGPRR